MKLTENTQLSVGIAIALIGGAGWLTEAHFQGVSNASEIQSIKLDLKDIQAMKQDVAVIKSDLKRVLKRIGDE